MTASNKENQYNMAVRISTKHQVTIPRTVFEKLGLEIGEYLEGYVENGKIVFVRQKLIDRDQAYFWTPEWQEGESEASKDIAEGRVETFDDIEDLIADLDSDKQLDG